MIENSYDKIFVSDTHLSTKACNYKDLHKFLSNYYAPIMYLVGDIIDIWKLKTIDTWPKQHTKILYDFTQLLQDNVNLEYIIGNHDEFFDNLIGDFENLSLKKEEIITINNKKLLVTHGHQFDYQIRYFKWIGILLSGIADLLKKIRQSTFSMSDYLKNNKNKIGKFEKIALEYVKKRKLDGIICGHTHIPNLFVKNGLIYANTGDFVTNSSFITQKDNYLSLMAYEKNKVIEVKKIKI